MQERRAIRNDTNGSRGVFHMQTEGIACGIIARARPPLP